MITVENVTKKFGNFTAIEDLSLCIEPCSFYGLVGYNGAGKTTLLKTICGIYKPENGKVCINENNVFDNEEVKKKMFFIPDELYFIPQASMDRMANFFKGYFPKWDQDVFHKLCNMFELDPTKRLHAFSKGMQRQAYIIFALSTSAQYLVLDESFDGLDPLKRNVIKQILLEYMGSNEATLIISSHNLNEIEGLCDHIGLMNGKKIALNSAIDEIYNTSHKVRVVFDREVKQDIFADINYTKLNQSENIFTFIANDDMEHVKSILNKNTPVFIESIPLTLEEKFMEEMGGKEYDFKDLFEK